MCSKKKGVYPFQIREKMYENQYRNSHFFLSLEGQEGQIHNKNYVFQLIPSQRSLQ